MEPSHTLTQHWVRTPWPPTPVTLAMLSLEALPGLVGVMECGVGQLHLVKVLKLDQDSSVCLHGELFSCYNFILYPPTVTTVTCSDDLPTISNGGITYVFGFTNSRPVGATARYICFSGYRLVGVSVRTCGSDGVWSSITAPVCQSKE